MDEQTNPSISFVKDNTSMWQDVLHPCNIARQKVLLEFVVYYDGASATFWVTLGHLPNCSFKLHLWYWHHNLLDTVDFNVTPSYLWLQTWHLNSLSNLYVPLKIAVIFTLGIQFQNPSLAFLHFSIHDLAISRGTYKLLREFECHVCSKRYEGVT